VVHRDVSSANVMLSWQGEVKLTDFGIARSMAAGSRDLADGRLQGKIPYMSPEQTEGLEPGPESDIFSFGVMAYELLVGARPFDAETDSATIGKIRSGSRKRLRDLRPDLAPDLCQLIERCLSRLPHDRFLNGAQLEQGFRSLMADHGWVVGPGDVAELLNVLFPGDMRANRGDITSTAATHSGPDTRSLVFEPKGPGKKRAIVLILLGLLMLMSTAFGLAMVIDWHRAQGLNDVLVPEHKAELRDAGVLVDMGAVAQSLEPQSPDQDVKVRGQDVILYEDIRVKQVEDIAEDQPQDILEEKKEPADMVSAEIVDITVDAEELDLQIKDIDLSAQSLEDIAAGPSVEALALRPEPGQIHRKRVKQDLNTSVTKLTVQPRDAMILVDGVVGRKGSHFIRLEKGERVRVRLELDGYRGEEFTLRYPGPKRLSKILEAALQGTLNVRYYPATASLFLDGKKISSKSGMNIVKIKVSSGVHSLKLEGPDGRTLLKRVEVSSEGTTGITMEVD
jgi:Protein kinase domain